MKEENKNRKRWIDEVKGFGILCILLAHVVQYFSFLSPLNEYLCSFHVPIFFILAGMMCAVRSDSTFDYRRRCYSLLIPYVFFSIVNSVIKLGVLAIQHEVNSQVIKDEAIEFFVTGNGTVWFLPILLIADILGHQIIKLKNSCFIMAIMTVVLFALVTYVKIELFPIGVIIYRVLGALAYWEVGYLIFGAIKYWERNAGLIGFLCVALGIIVSIFFSPFVNFFSGEVTKDFISILASIVSSAGYIFLFIAADKRETVKYVQGFLSYYGKNSLIVMLVHPIFLQIIMYPFGSALVNGSNGTSVLISFLIYVFLVLVEIPCIFILNEYFPFLIGKRRKA